MNSAIGKSLLTLKKAHKEEMLLIFCWILSVWNKCLDVMSDTLHLSCICDGRYLRNIFTQDDNL